MGRYFTRKRYRDIIVDAFNYCIDNKQLKVHSWCMMSNHVHCILNSKNGTLSDTVRDFKRHTAKTILQSIEQEPESRRVWMLFQFKHAADQHVRNTYYQIWTHENHAVGIDAQISTILTTKLNYIHNNPVKEGIVANAIDYVYSSAADYVGKKGLVKIDLLMWAQPTKNNGVVKNIRRV